MRLRIGIPTSRTEAMELLQKLDWMRLGWRLRRLWKVGMPWSLSFRLLDEVYCTVYFVAGLSVKSLRSVHG